MSNEAKEMKEMLSIYKPSSDMMQLFNIIPSLFLAFHTISNTEAIKAAWFSVAGKNKKDITLTISDLETERKLFSFSFSDEDDFQKIVNVFLINVIHNRISNMNSVYTKITLNLANYCYGVILTKLRKEEIKIF
ncbi:hypothetical protein [Bartonella raoultii]|uniref:hypothetical protein n=1 Tax=Bartonella raoultii TaxID=1457020 RepID=UPI001ABBAE40|nr:hypothetical protein [Bartonella raoultii]